MRLRTLIICGACLALAACQDSETFTEPDVTPVAYVSDGAHGGNPNFFFLPPIVPEPEYGGEFDGSLQPYVTVEICEPLGAYCGAFVGDFSGGSGPGSETVRLVPEEEHYLVNWHSRKYDLTEGRIYRIQVRAHHLRLGIADVVLVADEAEAKEWEGTGTFALVSGRTLPIRFRIEEGALPDPEWLIADRFLTWFHVDQSYYSAGMALSVMADERTSSWGNSYMRDGSQEPRQAIPNDPDANYAYVFERPWFRDYSVLLSVRDGLIAIAGEDGELLTEDDWPIGADGEDTPRAVAFAKLLQGLAHGYLGLLYDRAFILDETTDVGGMGPETFGVDARPYDEVIDAAVGYLEEAIDVANAYSFTIPPEWVGDAAMDNQELARVAHSYAARFLAGSPRSPAERAAVDWNAVVNHVDQGIACDFYVEGDGYNLWYSDFKWTANHPTWARTDLRMLGPAGSSVASNQAWRDWEDTPPQPPGLRLPFDIDTDDARMPLYPPVQAAPWGCVGVPVRTASCGLYFEYRNPYQPFRWERGTYHFSGYADYRWHDYTTTEYGPIVLFNQAENDLLKAEGLIRMGSSGAALPLVNAYRVPNGQLLPATAGGAPEIAGRCTPRNLDGSCADLFEAMKYEKRMEVYMTGMGVAFWDDRGWGDLLTRTPLHFPIPAEQLIRLLQEIYTFGGDEGGAAPDLIAWTMVPGGLKPLVRGEVPTLADIAARVQLFRAIDAADDVRPPLKRQ